MPVAAGTQSQVLVTTPQRTRSQSPAPIVNSTPPSARPSMMMANGRASVPTPPPPFILAEAPAGQQLPIPIATPSVAYSQPVIEVIEVEKGGGLTKPRLSSPTLGPPPPLPAPPAAPVMIPGLPETTPFR